MAVDRMQKYVRVLRRVNRVYLGGCKRTDKHRRLADKLGKRLEAAFHHEHPMTPIEASGMEPATGEMNM